MKPTIRIILAVMCGIVLTAPQVSAAAPAPEKQWGAPVPPGGTVVGTEDTAVFIEYNQPYETVLAWYKEKLKDYKDEKYRDWNDQMYIEDQGGAQWHSIGIFKGGGSKTTVKIVKDNFTWVFSTLLIRFAGVFIVLCFLWIFLNMAGSLMKKFFPSEKKVTKPASA